MRNSNRNIIRAMELSRRLLFCADKGDLQREDDGCGVLFGIVRDCAYKILLAAEQEKEKHVNRGIWDIPEDFDESQL